MDRSSAARVSLRRARSCCCSCWTPPIARAFKKGMIDIGQDAMWSVAICASSLSMGEKLLNDWYSMGLGPGGGCQAGKQVLGSHACQRERGFAKISHSPPWNSRTHSVVDATKAKATAPCQCEANDPKWAPPTRNIPKCIFIDLGAADGNSFNAFLSNSYGPVLQFQQHRGFIGNISCDRICNECQHT
mmetsp:Transcript_97120/g.313013  ORF Transcript_97120/g.313013 Transcript_97120/m.313013 type:complete len:188 (+) Transcript_97120:269-832(+)